MSDKQERQVAEARALVAKLDVPSILALAEVVGSGGDGSSVMAAVLRDELVERNNLLAAAERLAQTADVLMLNAELLAMTGQRGRSRELTCQAVGLVSEARQARARAIPDDDAEAAA